MATCVDNPLSCDTPPRAALLLDDQPKLIAWAEGVIGCTFFSDARAIGWGSGDHVRAVTVYDRWSEGNCAIHIASDGTRRWLTRPFLAASFHYPFVLAGCHRITALIAADNVASLRFNQHLGFTHEGVLREGADNGCDMIVRGLLRRECRFIPPQLRGSDSHYDC